eukprot:ctg_5866.g653
MRCRSASEARRGVPVVRRCGARDSAGARGDVGDRRALTDCPWS